MPATSEFIRGSDNVFRDLSLPRPETDLIKADLAAAILPMADELLRDLPNFLERCGTDEQCRAYLVRALWPDGFGFNRRTARSIAHRFARLIQHAVQTPPTTYRAIASEGAT
jgi:hypothetical protein